MHIQSVYCINLEHRHDRWERVQQEFKEHLPGIEVKRFNAVLAAPGWVGCRDSHLAVIELCRNEELFLILEDDVEFVGNVHEVLELAISQLPEDWEMLYLGANLMAPIHKYSANLCLLKQAYAAHAILFNNRNGLANGILSMRDEIRKIDVLYEQVIQPRGKVFVTYPLIATQCDGYSNITRRNNNYSQEFIENFNSKVLK